MMLMAALESDLLSPDSCLRGACTSLKKRQRHTLDDARPRPRSTSSSVHIHRLTLPLQKIMDRHRQRRPSSCDGEDEKFLTDRSLNDEEADIHDVPSFFLQTSSCSQKRPWVRSLQSPLCLHIALVACYTVIFLAALGCLSRWRTIESPQLIDSTNSLIFAIFSLALPHEFLIT